MVFYGDLMGFNGDLIGFGGDFFLENSGRIVHGIRGELHGSSHGQNIVVALFREIPSLI